MAKTLILLSLICVGAYARVAILDEKIEDVSNVIDEILKLNITKTRADWSTIKTNDVDEIVSTTQSNGNITSTSIIDSKDISSTEKSAVTEETSENDVSKGIYTTTILPNSVKDEKFNEIDSGDDENSVLPPIDIGKPLKLTGLLKENRFEEARAASKALNPEFFLGVESYSGFLTVNETFDSNIFFWYFPVLEKPVNETPWLIWLQGGPGASGMTGLFEEIGPIHFQDGILTANPYTWLQNHSLLFIDSPVGTGFSFTNSTDGFATDMETYTAHLYSTVQQFLQMFPELRAAPLYVAGESYGGKYVPALAMQLHRHKDEPGQNVNLQGLITGNAYVDPAMIANIQRPFYNLGLINLEQMEELKPLNDALQKAIADNNGATAKFKWTVLLSYLLTYARLKHAYNFMQDDLIIGRYEPFLKRPEIRRAIHVGDAGYSSVNMTVNNKLAGEFLTSSKWMYEELLNHYRVLTYCGQLDLMMSCVATSENYRTWKWNGTEEFKKAERTFYHYGTSEPTWTAHGYYKSGGNLTEAVIRGAGHMVPQDQPGPIRYLVTEWTHHKIVSTQFIPIPLLFGNKTTPKNS